MPIMHVVFKMRHIDTQLFQEEFHILKIDNHHVTWKKENRPPVPGGNLVLTWMQYGNKGVRIPFLTPVFIFVIDGIEQPRQLYSNVYLTTTFELIYHQFYFKCTQ